MLEPVAETGSLAGNVSSSPSSSCSSRIRRLRRSSSRLTAAGCAKLPLPPRPLPWARCRVRGSPAGSRRAPSASAVAPQQHVADAQRQDQRSQRIVSDQNSPSIGSSPSFAGGQQSALSPTTRHEPIRSASSAGFLERPAEQAAIETLAQPFGEARPMRAMAGSCVGLDLPEASADRIAEASPVRVADLLLQQRQRRQQPAFLLGEMPCRRERWRTSPPP
jgi:hypothetical protein